MDDIQLMLQDAAQALLGDTVTPDLLQRAEQGQFDHGLWLQLSELGFTQALVCEEAGGSGLGWRQVYPLVHAAGRHALPQPLPETMLASYLLDRAGSEPVAPQAALTVAQAAQGMCRRSGGRMLASGVLAGVPFARQAQRIVLVADVQGDPHVGWFEPGSGGVSIPQHAEARAAGLTISREARDDVALESVVVQDCRPVPAIGRDAVRHYGAMLRAAQMAGAIERVLEMSLLYAGDRVQFGKPLARFQAIQHHLAELGCEAGAAAMAAAHAFGRMDEGDAALAVASAKIRAGQAAGRAAALAHAVHGAIGFTYEHSLHYMTRRLWTWRSEYGSQGWWSARLGRGLCAVGAPHWWEAATSGRLDLRDDDNEKETAA